MPLLGNDKKAFPLAGAQSVSGAPHSTRGKVFPRYAPFLELTPA